MRGFVADSVTYWFETRKRDEAHYLCALRNAPLVDEAIKPYQTKGAFGALRGGGHRHVHRRPFEVLPIPRYSASNELPRRLAALSRKCHAKVERAVAEALVQRNEPFFTDPIGRLRTQLRSELLQDELRQINHCAGELLA